LIEGAREHKLEGRNDPWQRFACKFLLPEKSSNEARQPLGVSKQPPSCIFQQQLKVTNNKYVCQAHRLMGG
jgi:hypothetical protein